MIATTDANVRISIAAAVLTRPIAHRYRACYVPHVRVGAIDPLHAIQYAALYASLTLIGRAVDPDGWRGVVPPLVHDLLLNSLAPMYFAAA